MGPAAHEQHLDLARRHLAAAQGRIARQRALLAELRARGDPTNLATELLNSLLETERQMRRHYDILQSERPRR